MLSSSRTSIKSLNQSQYTTAPAITVLHRNMPAIENPMSSADEYPDMASITIHDSRLNLSVMDIQRLARMEHQKNASIYFAQKGDGERWRQIHLDEVRTTKCLDLLQQLAKELSPLTEEVSIDEFQTEKDQSEAKSAIKHPGEFDRKQDSIRILRSSNQCWLDPHLPYQSCQLFYA